MTEQVDDFLQKRLDECEGNLKQIAEVYEMYGELFKLVNRFRATGDFLAFNFNDGTHNNFTPVMFRHSMHRFCPAWNFVKSRKIRSIWSRFLADTATHIKFEPVHLVLTLPHPEGVYTTKDGRRLKFFGKELKNIFNLIRKKPFWQNAVYGGEYGLETKRGKNGLHIHIHSLTFLQKGTNLNDFRENFIREWKVEAGLPADSFPQIWIEHLYFFKKDTSGAWISEAKHKTELREIDDLEELPTSTVMAGRSKSGEMQIETVVFHKKKHYVWKEVQKLDSETEMTPEEKEQAIIGMYTQGILECIKYHFKQDSLMVDENSKQYDIELMNEVLKETKGQRLYDRFGKLTGHAKQLDISPRDIYNLSMSGLGASAEEKIEKRLGEFTQKELDFMHRFGYQASERELDEDEIELLDQIESGCVVNIHPEVLGETVEIPEYEEVDESEFITRAKRDYINPRTGEIDANGTFYYGRPERLWFAKNEDGTFKCMTKITNHLTPVDGDADSLIKQVAMGKGSSLMPLKIAS